MRGFMSCLDCVGRRAMIVGAPVVCVVERKGGDSMPCSKRRTMVRVSLLFRVQRLFRISPACPCVCAPNQTFARALNHSIPPLAGASPPTRTYHPTITRQFVDRFPLPLYLLLLEDEAEAVGEVDPLPSFLHQVSDVPVVRAFGRLQHRAVVLTWWGMYACMRVSSRSVKSQRQCAPLEELYVSVCVRAC